MPYVVIVRDFYDPESISFVAPGGETLREAQAARDKIEADLPRRNQTSIFVVSSTIPAWEREG